MMKQMITPSKTPRAITVIGYWLLAIVLSACTGGDGSQRRAQLEELERQNRADSVMTNDSLAEQLVKYFDRHGTPNERMRAHYILGRTYADMGEAPMALECYQDAISLADTTAADCDYLNLSSVYSQMAVIFHQQNLPQDEIKALRKHIHYTKKLGDQLRFICSQSLLIKPYYLLDEKDTVLQIINNNYQQLMELGFCEEATYNLGTAIYIYTERQQFDKAKQLIEIYERDSNLFDKEGNIARGREGYYWTKGFYELGIDQIDSAEFYFRKAICQSILYDDISNGYKGMLAVYEHKQNLDSIVHYSHLNEAALDSLHNRMQIDAIHQAASLYNYTRSLKQAEQEAQKKREAWYWFAALSVLVFILLCLAYSFYNKKQREKQEKIRQLDHSLSTAKKEYCRIKEELEKIKSEEFDALEAQTEKNRKMLEQDIIEMEKESRMLIGLKQENHLEDFTNSHIVRIFAKKYPLNNEHPIPNKAEWKLLVKQFMKDMPLTYRFFKENKLSELQIRICILLLLDYKEGAIVELANSTSESVSVAKRRVNERLFSEKGAKTLKYNLEKLFWAS